MFDVWISSPSRFDGFVEFNDNAATRSAFNESINALLNFLISSDILADCCDGHC